MDRKAGDENMRPKLWKMTCCAGLISTFVLAFPLQRIIQIGLSDDSGGKPGRACRST